MVGALIALAVVLIFVVLFQIARTSELLSVIKGEGMISKRTNKINGALMLIFMVLFLVGSIWSTIAYLPRFLPSPSSEHGHLIDEMFNWTLFFTGIVFIATTILLFWFAFKYREKEGQTAYYFPHNNKLEVLWTAVPAVVLTILVAMGIENWNKITAPAPEGTEIVEVTGQQFNWILRYPGIDGELGDRDYRKITGENTLGIDWTDPRSKDDFMPNNIVLKVGQPVLFKLGAKDVLHSFFLPHFRVKMDCVPGVPTRFWMTPTRTTAEARIEYDNPDFDFELACTELCGSAHWNMRKTVTVVSDEEYEKWFSEQQPIYELLGLDQEEVLDDVVLSKDNSEEDATSTTL